MLATLVKGTEWSQLTEYLSPVFFQIVPPLKMAGKLKSLAGGYLSSHAFNTALTTIRPALETSGLGVSLVAPGSVVTAQGGDDDSTRRRRGDLILRLYFWQIFNLDVNLLDFRRRAFHSDGDQLVWQPAALFNHWDKDFVAAVRQMYIGFYHTRHDIMDTALHKLGLYGAKDTLLNHFGTNQDCVYFDLAKFRSTFHDVFLACKKARSQLHPDFLALGGILACLYEHLEQLGLGLDVKAAFHDVIRDVTV
ncbi:MAG: hypothetical protein FJ146_06865 [Deltaproteobacteria bacterium]|nr:hypothetical protein [Deltaproteobacteria bacterium]